MIQDRIALLEIEVEKATVEAANLYFQTAVGGENLVDAYTQKRDELSKLESDLRIARYWLATNGK